MNKLHYTKNKTWMKVLHQSMLFCSFKLCATQTNQYVVAMYFGFKNPWALIEKIWCCVWYWIVKLIVHWFIIFVKSLNIKHCSVFSFWKRRKARFWHKNLERFITETRIINENKSIWILFNWVLLERFWFEIMR